MLGEFYLGESFLAESPAQPSIDLYPEAAFSRMEVFAPTTSLRTFRRLYSNPIASFRLSGSARAIRIGSTIATRRLSVR